MGVGPPPIHGLPLELHGDDGGGAVLHVVLPLAHLVTVRHSVITPLPLDGVAAGQMVMGLTEDSIDGVRGVLDQLLVCAVSEHGHSWPGLHVIVLALADPLHHLVPDDPVDAGHAGYSVLRTNSVGDEPLPDFPGEHGGVLPLVLGNGVHHMGCSHLGFTASNNTSSECSGFVIS